MDDQWYIDEEIAELLSEGFEEYEIVEILLSEGYYVDDIYKALGID